MTSRKIWMGLMSGALFLGACDEEKEPAESQPVEDKQSAANLEDAAKKKAQAAEASETTASAESLDSLDEFEGAIQVELIPDDEEQRHVVSMKVKDGVMRIELPSKAEGISPGYQIVDLQKGTMLSVVHEQKMAVELSFEKLKEEFDNVLPSGAEGEAKLEKTGKKDEVAGLDCQQWKVTPPERNPQLLCVADISTKWFSFPEDQRPSDEPWAQELLDGKHFPLRIVQLDDDGKPAEQMQVIEISPKKLEGDLFAVPDGYRRVSMQDMMKRMGLPSGGPQQPELSPEAMKMLKQAAEKSKQAEQATTTE